MTVRCRLAAGFPLQTTLRRPRYGFRPLCLAAPPCLFRSICSCDPLLLSVMRRSPPFIAATVTNGRSRRRRIVVSSGTHPLDRSAHSGLGAVALGGTVLYELYPSMGEYDMHDSAIMLRWDCARERLFCSRAMVLYRAFPVLARRVCGKPTLVGHRRPAQLGPVVRQVANASTCGRESHTQRDTLGDWVASALYSFPFNPRTRKPCEYC